LDGFDSYLIQIRLISKLSEDHYFDHRNLSYILVSNL